MGADTWLQATVQMFHEDVSLGVVVHGPLQLKPQRDDQVAPQGKSKLCPLVQYLVTQNAALGDPVKKDGFGASSCSVSCYGNILRPPGEPVDDSC